ncbi:MAG: stage II sporulation protein M [Planctomycetaceae bacterium]
MTDFVTRNKPDWDELESLLARARKSVKRLSPEELSRLDLLYRRVTVHLAQVRSRSRDARLATYLNQLAGAAHSLIYLPPRQKVLAGIGDFLRNGFAQSIARGWKYHLTSALLLLSGAVLAYYATSNDALAAHALLPAGETRQPGATKEQLLEMLRSNRDADDGYKFLFASFLFSHNLKVGLVSMGLGVLACVPTVFLVVYNGMIIGAFMAVHTQAGVGPEAWAWILPHGITEIGAIMLCGGIGLMLGMSVISPGLKTRGASLVDAGNEGIRIAAGVGIMLCCAAIIESYLRQSHLSTEARLTFAAGTAVFWGLYIAHGFAMERRIKRRSGTVVPDTD